MTDVDRLLHQIRNPLTAIMTFAKLWQRRSEPEDPNAWLVERILGEAEHLRALLTQYEAMPALAPQPLPLRSFIQRLWPIYDAIAQERQLKLEHDWDQAEATLTLDPVLLRQVIDNIMDNAFKYSRTWVKLRLRLVGEQVWLEISDDGPGIDTADQQRIFEPYFRAASLNQPGQGLGLAIAKDLCERLGGSLSVESVPTQGTTFRICLGGAA